MSPTTPINLNLHPAPAVRLAERVLEKKEKRRSQPLPLQPAQHLQLLHRRPQQRQPVHRRAHRVPQRPLLQNKIDGYRIGTGFLFTDAFAVFLEAGFVAAFTVGFAGVL